MRERERPDSTPPQLDDSNLNSNSNLNFKYDSNSNSNKGGWNVEKEVWVPCREQRCEQASPRTVFTLVVTYSLAPFLNIFQIGFKFESEKKKKKNI